MQRDLTMKKGKGNKGTCNAYYPRFFFLPKIQITRNGRASTLRNNYLTRALRFAARVLDIPSVTFVFIGSEW